MSTRVIRNGRTVYKGYRAGEAYRARPPELCEDEIVRQQDALAHLPIAAGRVYSIADRQAERTPQPAAVDTDLPWHCPTDRVTYRPVSPILTEHGWGTLGFWMRRWNLDAEGVLRLVRNRYLDAATEPGSAVKWYRVLDERAVLDVIRTMRVARSQVRESAPKKGRK